MENKHLKVVAFAASNSSVSINRRLIDYAAAMLKEEVAPHAIVNLLDLNDFEAPIYSFDREKSDGIPDEAKRFFAMLGDADALLVSYAEHNGHHPAAYKNLFDWASRIEQKVYQGKPMIAMSASPGARGGASVLSAVRDSARRFGADIRGGFSVGPFAEKFDLDRGCLTDSEQIEHLREALRQLL